MTKRRTTGRRRRRGHTSFKKLAISLPADLARKIEHEVVARNAPSLSALVTDALSLTFERDGLDMLIEEMLGDRPLTKKEIAWARKVLGD